LKFNVTKDNLASISVDRECRSAANSGRSASSSKAAERAVFSNPKMRLKLFTSCGESASKALDFLLVEGERS